MSTTTSPAPVTPPPRLGALSNMEELSGTHDRWRTALRWVGDVVSAFLLIGVVWWLSYHDGGRDWTATARLGILAVAALPFSVGELRRLPGSFRLLLLLWPVGLIASVAFAVDRSGFPGPLVIFSLMPLIGLAAHRVWRRPWGPVAVLIVLTVGFGAYWQRSFLQWWGYALTDGHTLDWHALSWHNQSGTLMAAFGLLFSGLALSSRKALIPVGVLLSAGAFAGMWLTGSRGALVAALIGAVVLLVGTVRRVGWLRTGVSTGAVVAGAAVVTLGLLGMGSQSTGATATHARPDAAMGGRTQSAETSLRLRLYHWEAATGMFVDSPVTGHGLGSFRNMSLPFTSPDATLTSQPHNVYLRALAEGGTALAVPFIGLMGAGAVLVWSRLRHRPGATGDPEVTVDDVRGPLSLGAAAAVSMLIVHQGVDFDWTYPVLPGLLALGMGSLAADIRREAQGGEAPSGRFLPVAVAGLIGLVLITGMAATFREDDADRRETDDALESVAPWDAGGARAMAADLHRNGKPDIAERVLDRAITWNPGLHGLRVQRAVVAHSQGELLDRALIDLALEAPWDVSSINDVAEELIVTGSPRLAESVLRSLLETYVTYSRWGMDGSHAKTWQLLVRATAEGEGCGTARRVAMEARTAYNFGGTGELAPIEEVLAETCEGRRAQ